MFLLIYSMISTVFAILNKLPYEFGGTGSPDTVAADSLTHGTAISPPITVLILLAVLAILTSRRGWIGTVAIIGVILLAILFLVAGLGEPIIWRTLQARTFGMFEFAVLGLSCGFHTIVMHTDLWLQRVDRAPSGTKMICHSHMEI